MAVPRRGIGSQGLQVSALGLGCFTMSDAYGGDDSEGLRVIDAALEHGVDFLDTSNAYGRDFANERLVARAIAGRRDRFVLGTKFGVLRRDGGVTGIRGDGAYVRSACEESLRRLGTDHVDVYYQHRVDPEVPIEETVGAMAELVREGKVRYIGLCEAAPETIERAHAVHPLSAVQTEYSLWSREVEGRILPTLRRLGIGLVPYSPLGRGFLTGAVREETAFGERDYRRGLPRFQGENLVRNLRLVDELRALAEAKGATAAQAALAWILHRGNDIVPIPGMDRVALLEENVRAASLELAPEDMARLDDTFAPEAVAGARYSEEELEWVDR